MLKVLVKTAGFKIIKSFEKFWILKCT
jgi:hypothetical protein